MQNSGKCKKAEYVGSSRVYFYQFILYRYGSIKESAVDDHDCCHGTGCIISGLCI